MLLVTIVLRVFKYLLINYNCKEIDHLHLVPLKHVEDSVTQLVMKQEIEETPHENKFWIPLFEVFCAYIHGSWPQR